MLDGAVLADMLRPVRSTSAELLLPDLERKYSDSETEGELR